MSRSAPVGLVRFVALAAAAAIVVDARASGQEIPQSPMAPVVGPGEENPTRLLVKVKRGADRREVAEAHARAGGRVVRDLPQIGWQIVEVPYGEQRDARARYEGERSIARADLDRARRVAHVPNDPYWGYQWHMKNIKADLAWDTVKGDPAVVVAVMDTGLLTTHPDLAANVWVNPGEILGNGLDDDGNGYVDDVHGYDFAYGDPDPDDVHGHGTACAGLVAAVQDNSIGVTGVAPLCRLAGVKAANNSGYFYDSANVPALLYCADMGFKVVSMSFFSDEVTPAERDAIDYCWQRGVVLVAAAGNSLSVIPYYPAAYENVIAVAATDSSDNPTWFTDYGSWVDVAAPGLGLATTTKGNGYTTGFAGTSGSAPHVAGLAGLLFAASPGATNRRVRAALEDTAASTIWAPWGEYTNYGKVDCDAAVDRVQGATSGSKPARLLFAAPVGGGDRFLPGARYSPEGWPLVRFFGVGFETPNVVDVRTHGRSLPLIRQDRRVVIASLEPAGTGPGAALQSEHDLRLDVNGATVGGITWDQGPGLVYAPTDVGTYGATVVGGFQEIYRVDGRRLTCDDDGAGRIYCEIPVRKVAPLEPDKVTIEFTRSYGRCRGGTETLYLYDWSTWSYPYGSWITVWSRTIPDHRTETVTAAITTAPGNYIDDEGTMYFVLQTTGAGSAGILRADAFRVRLE